VVHLEAAVARPGTLAKAELQQLAELIARFSPDVVHVDSYELPGSIDSLVTGSTVMSNMEDGTFGRRRGDVLVDATLGAERSPRPEDGSTWLLRGSRYTPVRQRVLDARRRAAGDAAGRTGSNTPLPKGQPAVSVMVVMGGTDPVGLTPVAIGLLARTGLALDVTAIAVGENAQRARAAAEGSALSLSVLAPVDDLPAMMSGKDLVISAAGTSVSELCCIGVPAAVVWTVANQREGYGRVVDAGAAIGLGGPDLAEPGVGADKRAVELLTTALTDSRVRADLVLAGRRVVDGLGAWRVARTWEMAHVQQLSPAAARSTSAVDAPVLVARPATLADAGELWRWRNDPATRAGSRSSAQVPWDDHVRWLTASLSRTDRLLLLVEDQVGSSGAVGAVGTVRWDLMGQPEGSPPESHEWEVSITVAPERRGQSLARPLLRAAEVALWETTRSSGTGVTAYLAAVHVDNRASTRLFESSGYLPDLPPDQQGFMRYRKTPRVP
jgi:spore coat polysaccharide biosynthesis predicted glycosyltransferase SpsG/RimJ/RimL family protein N-acetyltransferase